jgi:hypothetical protein
LIDEAHTTSRAAASSASGSSAADELRKLAELHSQGVLTQEEFEAAKARVLQQ